MQEPMTLSEMKAINEWNNDNHELRKGNSVVSISIKRQKYDCFCGGKYTYDHKAQHKRSKKHQDFMDKLTPEEFYQIFRFYNL